MPLQKKIAQGKKSAAPIVQRIKEDPAVRKQLNETAGQLKQTADALRSHPAPATALFEDKKVQESVRRSSESVRRSIEQLQPKKKSYWGLKLLVMAAVLALIGYRSSQQHKNY